MNKPLTLSVEELKLQLVETINKAQLPLYCIRIAMQDLIKEVIDAENKEIEDFKKTQSNDIINLENNNSKKKGK